MSRTDRYERQSRFAEIGQAGQSRLAASRVAVLGCGALGSVAAEILARAGVGHLTLIDRDTVEWSNLQRQSLYLESDAELGRAKADAAAERIGEFNSDITVVPEVVDVTADNIASLCAAVDLVIDGTDNFGTRFLLNDYSLERQLPWVHGGCVGATGQVASFSGQGKPCFRCIVPLPPDPAVVQTCDTAGVVGAATHTVASLQAMAAIRILTQPTTTPLEQRYPPEVLSLDLWSGRIRNYAISPVDCPACTAGRRDFLHGRLAAAADRTAVLCGRNAVQVHATGMRIDLDRIADRWRSSGSVEQNAFFVRLHLLPERSATDHPATDPHASEAATTITLFRDGRAVVGGTENLGLARSLYARFVGG